MSSTSYLPDQPVLYGNNCMEPQKVPAKVVRRVSDNLYHLTLKVACTICDPKTGELIEKNSGDPVYANPNQLESVPFLIFYPDQSESEESQRLELHLRDLAAKFNWLFEIGEGMISGLLPRIESVKGPYAGLEGLEYFLESV